MVDEGLVRYIRERLGEGYKEDNIRAALLQHGHGEAEISEAFGNIHRSTGKPLLLILIGLIGIGLVLFFLLRPTADQPPIKQEPTPTVEIPNDNVITLAAQMKKESANKTPDEVYYETVQTATSTKRSESEGVLLCSVNENTTYKNYCLTELASQQRDVDFCKLIGSLEQRDDCLLTLILDGEDQYCPELILEENKEVCRILLGEA